jgi:hypothetical protein
MARPCEHASRSLQSVLQSVFQPSSPALASSTVLRDDLHFAVRRFSQFEVATWRPRRNAARPRAARVSVSADFIAIHDAPSALFTVSSLAFEASASSR